MAFSALAGLMGGMAHATDQVIDRNLTRMDAEGVAKEKEAAQMRLEQRAVDAVAARRKLEHSPEYLAENWKNEQANMDGSPLTKQARADVEKKQGLDAQHSANEGITATSHKDDVQVKKEHYEREDANTKAKNESKAETAESKALKETALAARVHAGAGMLDYVFGKGLDISGRAVNPNAIDNDQLYMVTRAKYEDAVRKGELPFSASSRLLLEAIGGDKAKKKSLEDYTAQQKAIKDNKPWWDFSDDKPAAPSATAAAVKPTVNALPPAAERKDGDVAEIAGAKRVWNSKARDGKGGWDAIAPVTETTSNPKGLMGEQPPAAVPTAPAKAEQKPVAINPPSAAALAETVRQTSKFQQQKQTEPTAAKAKEATPSSSRQPTELEKQNIENAKSSRERANEIVEKGFQEALKSNLSGKELLDKLSIYVTNAEFVKNHPEAVQIYQQAMEEDAAFRAEENKRKNKFKKGAK